MALASIRSERSVRTCGILGSTWAFVKVSQTVSRNAVRRLLFTCTAACSQIAIECGTTIDSDPVQL